MSATPPRKKTILLILDGFGYSELTENNAIKLAKTPFFDRIFQQVPYTLLDASSHAVGLPFNQMGNSEVGHMTIGCGTVLKQDLVKIDDAISSGSFFENRVLLDAINRAKKINRPLHLLGLVSNGGVHSHINHLIALMQLCHQHDVQSSIHMITDGRDTAPQSALQFLQQLSPWLDKTGAIISTIHGRYYAMDRDKRWERTEMSWKAMCFGEGRQAASAKEVINDFYQQGKGDEFIVPTVLQGAHFIEKNDQVIFFNFRNDRARQLTYVLAGKDFRPFKRLDFEPVSLTCLTEYDPKLDLSIAFPPEFPEDTLAKIISQQDIAQLHCAETEKYAHVTFFLNGGREQAYPLEERIMIPSPDVATYDLSPAMSAKAVSDTLITAIQQNNYGFIVANYANGDMVGHTAIAPAVIQAVETLDQEVSRVVDVALAADFSIIITADHGNCELMIDPVSGSPHTQHTTNPVPCFIFDEEFKQLKPGMGLANIAATVLKLLGISAPSHFKCAIL